MHRSLAKHAEAIKLARTLKDFRGEGHFAIKWGPDFFSTNVEPLQRCRNIVSLLNTDAMLRTEDGDTAGAMESYPRTAGRHTVDRSGAVP